MYAKTNSMSLEKYTTSKPSNIQYSVTRRRVHPDFALYVSQYRPQTLESIDTEHLDSETAAAAVQHYQKSQALLFHPIWINLQPGAYGSANWQLYKLRRDESTYRLEQYGISDGRSTVELSDAALTLDEKKITFESNNGNKVELERTGHLYDTNLYSPGTNPNPVAVWRLTVHERGSLSARVYLVELTM